MGIFLMDFFGFFGHFQGQKGFFDFFACVWAQRTPMVSKKPPQDEFLIGFRHFPIRVENTILSLSSHFSATAWN